MNGGLFRGLVRAHDAVYFRDSVSVAGFSSVHRLHEMAHSSNDSQHLKKKQPQMLTSTELHCDFYFCFFSQHSLPLSLSFFFLVRLFITSVPTSALKVIVCVLKQSAVPSGDVLTFISWIYNKTLGGASLVFPCWAPNNTRLLFGFSSQTPALVFSALTPLCRCIWWRDSLDMSACVRGKLLIHVDETERLDLFCVTMKSPKEFAHTANALITQI